MTEKRLGNFLKGKREQKGLTQAQVAAKLGYGSPQFISNIERGISRVPIKSLKSFIMVYELDANEVVDVLLEEQKAQLMKQIGLASTDTAEDTTPTPTNIAILRHVP